MSFRTNHRRFPTSLFPGGAEHSKNKEKMKDWFSELWKRILNVIFRRKESARSPYVNEQVVNVPKDEMAIRIAEVLKKGSGSDDG
jgi:hypothetical protein